MQSGSLIINCLSGRLLRDTETFGKMDPYVIFKIGGQSCRTKQAKDMGKNPVWNQEFNVRFSGEQLLNLDVFDEDIGKDDFIGQGSYSLMKLFNMPGKQVQEQIPINYKGKEAGMIFVNFTFNPDNQKQKNMNPPPGQGYQQNPFTQQNQQQQGFNQNPYGQQQQQGFNQNPYGQQQQGFNQNPYGQQQQYPQQQYNQQQYPPQQGFNQPPQHGFNQPPQHGFNQPPQQQQQFNQPPQYGYNQQGFNQPTHQQFNQPPQQQFNQGQYGQFNNPQQLQGNRPQIQFDPSCSKCRGTGVQNKKGTTKPCGKCYERAGYCKKCAGTMWDQKKNQRCGNCNDGRSNGKNKKDKKKK